MGMVHLTNREFGSLNVKADWSNIDRVVEDVVSKDKNHEIDAIGFVKGDVFDGEMLSCAVIVAIGKETASFELYKAVGNPSVSFEKEDRMPSDFVEIWRR